MKKQDNISLCDSKVVFAKKSRTGKYEKTPEGKQLDKELKERLGNPNRKRSMNTVLS